MKLDWRDSISLMRVGITEKKFSSKSFCYKVEEYEKLVHRFNAFGRGAGQHDSESSGTHSLMSNEKKEEN